LEWATTYAGMLVVWPINEVAAEFMPLLWSQKSAIGRMDALPEVDFTAGIVHGERCW